MKDFIKKCPVFLMLAASGLLFSLIGIIGRYSVYKEYEFHVAERPYLALMMEGISKGTMPWEVTEAIGMGADQFPGGLLYEWRNGNGGQMIGIPSEGEAEEALSESDGSVSALENEGVPEGVNGSDIQGAAGDSVDLGRQEGTGNSSEAGRQSAVGNSGEPGKQEPAADSGAPKEDRTYSFQTVTEDYFNDAVFIGDSRTVGLFEYGGIEERADFYAKISLTIYDVFTTPVAKDEETGKKITVEEALMKKKYGKVYLMLGINELGTGTTDTFMEEYEKVVDRIRELQPDAVIYVQGIMKVTGTKDAEDEIFNNTNIEDKNRAIAGLADNRDIFYIDVNEVVCDGEGNLNGEYTIDEVHLKAKYYDIWKQFLLEHGIVK